MHLPTIVYLVHGMGCGSKDGSAPPPGQDWTASAISTFEFLCTTFGLPKPSVVRPDDLQPPPNSADPNAIWLAPLSYYPVFDEFRSSSADRAKLAKGVSTALSDADITRLTKTDFAWTNCLDVLLWWADDIQTQNRVTATLGKGLTAINQLAATMPGATTRRIIVSHSLGTAATTATLRHLSTNQVWKNSTGFEAWFTLANVAPFLMEQDDVYDLSLLPDGEGSLIQPHMYNGRNECDPIPWLLPFRAFSPKRAGVNAQAWKDAESGGFYEVVETLDVAALLGETPTISGVHGYMNYMLSPDIALRLATHVRGSGFALAELAAINYTKTWNALPHLSCKNDKGAFKALRKEVANFKSGGPITVGGDPKVDWIRRLLDGTELLLSFEARC